METQALIQKFKDNNRIMENTKVLGMISYGSRINNYATNDSDLDILLVTDGKYSYVARQTIDGIKVDINIYSLDQIGYIIEGDREINNRYFVSVFNTGIIEKDENGIMEYLKDLVNTRSKDINGTRKLAREKVSELGNLYQRLMNANEEDVYKDYIYYNLLEKIRSNYNYMYNCSRLNFTKVYDIFSNKCLINAYYKLKLPKKEFIYWFMVALNTKDLEKRKELSKKLLGFLYLNVFDLSGGTILYEGTTKSKDELLFNVAYLKDRIKKVESMLISKHSASDSVYYILLYRIRELLFEVDMDCALDVELEFEQACLASDLDERIKSIEDLFVYIDKKFDLDYDNYLIKRY